MRFPIPLALATLFLLALPLLAADTKPVEAWDKTRTVKFSFTLTPGGHLSWELENRGDKTVKVVFKAQVFLKGDGASKRTLAITETLKGRGFKKDQYNLVYQPAIFEKARAAGLEMEVLDFRVEAPAKK